jgi:hypothetical protein
VKLQIFGSGVRKYEVELTDCEIKDLGYCIRQLCAQGFSGQASYGCTEIAIGELGDGEPSPPRSLRDSAIILLDEIEAEQCRLNKLDLIESALSDLRSRAAQEVSPPSPRGIKKRALLAIDKFLATKGAKNVDVFTALPCIVDFVRGETEVLRDRYDVSEMDLHAATIRAEKAEGDTRELKAALAELYEAASNEQYVDQLSIALERAEKLL